MRNNKKGVSAVVATVLIVMITVAAVGLLWAIVAPFLKTSVADKTACVDAGVSLEIDASSAFTCTDATTSKVRVARGSDSTEIVAIQIKHGDGTGDTTTDTNSSYPAANTEKVYYITGAISEVAVAAIIQSDGENITCDATPTVEVTRAC